VTSNQGQSRIDGTSGNRAGRGAGKKTRVEYAHRKLDPGALDGTRDSWLKGHLKVNSGSEKKVLDDVQNVDVSLPGY